MLEAAPSIPERVIRVLLVDDDNDDFVLTRAFLEDVPGTRFLIDWEPDADRAADSICHGDYDVCLIDHRLGIKTGLEVIQEAEQRNCTAPLILLTGQGERALDFAAMQAGAADYLEKGKLDSTLLDRSIRYAVLKKQSEELLERRVRERTAELARANDRLQEEVRERERAEQLLRDVDKRKDEFLATLAHELRNPLAPICNAIEIIKLGASNPEAVERARGVIERQVAHLVRLIDDLLDISRITRGKIELQKETVILADLVAGAVEGSQPLIDACRHELLVQLPEQSETLHVDQTRIIQVLMNLLNNAAKYTPPGGTIHLAVERELLQMRIRIRDNGIGIPPELLPHIFDLFAQVDKARQHAPGGLGIGLALARGLVELHGGTIAAHSDGPGRGSEFVVLLPHNAENAPNLERIPA